MISLLQSKSPYSHQKRCSCSPPCSCCLWCARDGLHVIASFSCQVVKEQGFYLGDHMLLSLHHMTRSVKKGWITVSMRWS